MLLQAPMGAQVGMPQARRHAGWSVNPGDCGQGCVVLFELGKQVTDRLAEPGMVASGHTAEAGCMTMCSWMARRTAGTSAALHPSSPETPAHDSLSAMETLPTCPLSCVTSQLRSWGRRQCRDLLRLRQHLVCAGRVEA